MRRILMAFLALLAVMVGSAAFAQAWPQKPIKIIVPYPPGGTSDIVARLVGEKIGARLGQPFVIDNRPGVAGILGTEVVVKSPPDGYTLVLTSTAPIAFAPSALYGRLASRKWTAGPVMPSSSISRRRKR